MSTLPRPRRDESTESRVGGPQLFLTERLKDASTHSNDLYLAMLSRHVEQRQGLAWLDVGCGWHLDWPWELEREKKLLSMGDMTGFDPDFQAITRHRTVTKRVAGIIEGLPFANGSFELVTANVVVEHLKYPGAAFSEIFRVLRPEGHFIFRTPSARSYFVKVARGLPRGLKIWLATKVIERRKPEDIYPAYYLANTAEQIGEICKTIGFRRVKVSITKPRAVLAARAPRLARVEIRVASILGFSEGSLIADIVK